MFDLLRRSLLVLCGTVLFTPAAFSQDAATDKPLRIVSPFPPGGANDIIARLIAHKLAANGSRTVLVENRPGAAGGIGTASVATSPPDGNTLVLGTLATHGINPSIYKSLQYDVVRDFAPIALVASIPIVLVVNPSLPATDVRQLIEMAKQRPGQVNFASSGIGSVNHLAGELFASTAGVRMVNIPYKGSSPALTDLLGGQVSVMFDLLPSSLPHIQSGKLRALAVTSSQRSALLPNLPTMAESGLPGYQVNSWFGILAPAKTPKATVTKLNSEVGKVLQSPGIREQMSEQGAEPLFSSPEEFGKVINADLATWAQVVMTLGLRQ